MRFYSASVVALFLNGVSAQLSSIGRYELLAAGNGTTNSPYGEVLSLEPLNGKVYIESHPAANVTIELFANASGSLPCANGTLVENGNVTSTFEVFTGNALSYPKSTSDGQIGVAEFSILDYTKAGIFTGSNGNGVIDLCVRTSIKKDIDGINGTYVSFVDSHLKINANLSAEFDTFSQDVNITATAALLQETSIVTTVEVESFLCGMAGINQGIPIASGFKIGQDFRVCVRPTSEFTDSYSVVSFKNVTCGYRSLVNGAGVPGILTTVETNLTGSKTANGTLVGNGTAAFTSVVTSGYFDGGKTSFTCDGEAVLAMASNRRRLTTRFSELPVSEQAFSRGLQQATSSEVSPFATTIDLVNDGADVDALAAPAFTTSQGGWGLLIVSAAVMMVGVV